MRLVRSVSGSLGRRCGAVILWPMLAVALCLPGSVLARANLTPVPDPFEAGGPAAGMPARSSIPPMPEPAAPDPVLQGAPASTPATGASAASLMLLYNPTRPSELSIFRPQAQRFIQLARAQRPKINAMTSRERIQFLENYVFALCNKRIVHGMQVNFAQETGVDSFCGYQPGMLNCYASDTCDEAAEDEAVRYIKAALARFDKFVRWSERRKWQYRGDALNVAIYTRNMPGRQMNTCSMLKVVNDNPQPVIVTVRGSVRTFNGQTHEVFGKPYYVAAKSSLPNLGDEDLFNKDTEARLRTLTSEVLSLSRRLSITDLYAYTGVHERWNCFPTVGNGSIAQPVIQQVSVEFPK